MLNEENIWSNELSLGVIVKGTADVWLTVEKYASEKEALFSSSETDIDIDVETEVGDAEFLANCVVSEGILVLREYS